MISKSIEDRRLINFWALMLEDNGRKFKVKFRAISRTMAYEQLRECYPKARILQLEPPPPPPPKKPSLVFVWRPEHGWKEY